MDVEINFHPKLTVLTGANGTGKSTLLGLLGRHFNWQRPYSSAPVRGRSAARWVNIRGYRQRNPLRESGEWEQVGLLKYSDTETTVNVPLGDGTRQHYDLLMPNQQAVPGLYLSSHRVVNGNYAAMETIPVSFRPAALLFDQFAAEVRSRWMNAYSNRSPMLSLKEALIGAALFSRRDGDFVEPNPEAEDIWHGYQAVLSAVLPKSLGFKRLRVAAPDLVVEADGGDFVIDESSGGISSIIEIAWQIFLYSRVAASGAVVFDEPENHLHPSLQRDLLPNLMAAFPSTQFIVATHSPFVVTSSMDSSVYALDYERAKTVVSRRLDYVNRAASAEATLTRVLGLSSTLPSWAERKFSEIVSAHMSEPITAESLVELRQQLSLAGLLSEFPGAMQALSIRKEGTD